MKFNLNPEEARIVYRDSVISIVNEPVRILNGIGVLSEIPDRTHHVVIDGYTEVYKENLVDLGTYDFVVNYNNGIIHFHPDTADNTTVYSDYHGRGAIFYPASRIYTQIKGGSIKETLQDVADEVETLKQIIQDTSAVAEVNGLTGVVTLSASDVGAVSTEQYSTDQTNADNRMTDIETNISNLKGTTFDSTDSVGQIRDDLENIRIDANNLNDDKSNKIHSHTESEIMDLDKYSREEVDSLIENIKGIFLPKNYASNTHSHAEQDIVDLDKYTKEEVNKLINDIKESFLPSNYSNKVHGHVESDIADLDKYNKSEVDSKLTNLETIYSKLNHGHVIDDVTDLRNELEYLRSKTDEINASDGTLDNITQKYLVMKKQNIHGTPIVDLFDNRTDFPSPLTEFKVETRITASASMGTDVVVSVEDVTGFKNDLEVVLYVNYEVAQVNAVIKSIDTTNNTVTISSLAQGVSAGDIITTSNAVYDSTNFKYTNTTYTDYTDPSITYTPATSVLTLQADLSQMSITEIMNMYVAGLVTGAFDLDVGIFSSTSYSGYQLSVHDDVDGENTLKLYEPASNGKQLFLRFRFSSTSEINGVYGVLNHLSALSLFQNVDSGKDKIATAIIDSTLSSDSTFQELADAIVNGKDLVATAIINKGGSGVSSTSTFKELADEIGLLSSGGQPSKITDLSATRDATTGDLTFSWTNTETVDGYNMYLNGEKLNTSLITTTSYLVPKNIYEEQSLLKFPDFRLTAVVGTTDPVESKPTDKLTTLGDYTLKDTYKSAKPTISYANDGTPSLSWDIDLDIYDGQIIRFYDTSTGEILNSTLHTIDESTADANNVASQTYIVDKTIYPHFEDVKTDSTITLFKTNLYSESLESSPNTFATYDFGNPVQNVKATTNSTTNTTIDVSWDAYSGAEGYLVITKMPDGSYIVNDHELTYTSLPVPSLLPDLKANLLASTSTSLALTNMSLDTEYTVYVYAFNDTDNTLSRESSVTMFNIPAYSVPTGDFAFLQADSTTHANLNDVYKVGDWFLDANGYYRSSDTITDSSTSESVMKIRSTEKTKVLLEFDVSTESGYDFFYVYLNGEEIYSGSGSLADIDLCSADLPIGDNVIKLAYSKDGSMAGGSDAVFVQKMIFMNQSSANATPNIANPTVNVDYEKIDVTFETGDTTTYGNDFKMVVKDKTSGHKVFDQTIQPASSPITYSLTDGVLPNREYVWEIQRINTVNTVYGIGSATSFNKVTSITTSAPTTTFYNVALITHYNSFSPVDAMTDVFAFKNPNLNTVDLSAYDLIYVDYLDPAHAEFDNIKSKVIEYNDNGVPLFVGGMKVSGGSRSYDGILSDMKLAYSEAWETTTTDLWDDQKSENMRLHVTSDYFGEIQSWEGEKVIRQGANDTSVAVGFAPKGTTSTGRESAELSPIGASIVYAPSFRADKIQNILWHEATEYIRESLSLLVGEVDKPAKPSGFTHTVNADGSVTFDWTANSETDLSHYVIYAKWTGQYAYLVLENNITTNTYTENSFVVNEAYDVGIRAVDVNGNYSDYTEIVDISVTSNDLAPAPVSDLTLDVYSDRVLLSWLPSRDLDLQGYNIYLNATLHNATVLSDTPREDGRIYYEISGLTEGTIYDVEVRAIDSGSVESTSTIHSITATANTWVGYKSAFKISNMNNFEYAIDSAVSIDSVSWSFYKMDGSQANISARPYSAGADYSKSYSKNTSDGIWSSYSASSSSDGYAGVYNYMEEDMLVIIDSSPIHANWLETKNAQFYIADLNVTLTPVDSGVKVTVHNTHKQILENYDIYVDGVNSGTYTLDANGEFTHTGLTNGTAYQIEITGKHYNGKVTNKTPAETVTPSV